MGKGDKRIPAQVSDQVVKNNWETIWPKKSEKKDKPKESKNGVSTGKISPR